MDTKSKVRVVIVGGGFGGLLAARTIAGNPVQVTLIDRQNFHTFQPLLYQVATAGLSPGEIAAPIRWILRRRRNVEVLMSEVQDFDLSRKVVKLPDGEVAYDYLIVASGASHAYFGHDEWEPFAPGLKTIEDALEIRRRVLLAFELAEHQAAGGKEQVQLNFVVVGGGPTGVELAGTLAEIARRALANEFRSIDPRKTRIVLLEGGPRILPAYPEDLSRSAEEQLRFLRRGARRRHFHATWIFGVERHRHVDDDLALHLGLHAFERAEVRRVGHGQDHRVGLPGRLRILHTADARVTEFGIQLRRHLLGALPRA